MTLTLHVFDPKWDDNISKNKFHKYCEMTDGNIHENVTEITLCDAAHPP